MSGNKKLYCQNSTRIVMSKYEQLREKGPYGAKKKKLSFFYAIGYIQYSTLLC